MMKADKKSPQLSEIMLQMIKIHPVTSGYVSNVTGVNVTKVAEAIGLPQPSLKKILDNKTRSMRFETEELFKRFFDINSAQLRGEQPIQWLEESISNEIAPQQLINHSDNEKMNKLKSVMGDLSNNELEELLEFVIEQKNKKNS